MIFRFSHSSIFGMLSGILLFVMGGQLVIAEPEALSAQKTAITQTAAKTTRQVNNDRLIMGWLEPMYLADIPLLIRAKLDTGAKTSSLHGRVIKQFMEDGQPWVLLEFDWFQLSSARRRAAAELGTEASDLQKKNRQVKSKVSKFYQIKVPLVGEVKIKDHDNPSNLRWVVRLPINVAGRCHEVNFTVANRKHFNYGVLLGRNFLEKAAIVDAKQTFLTAGILKQSFEHKKVTREALKRCNDLGVASKYVKKNLKVTKN